MRRLFIIFLLLLNAAVLPADELLFIMQHSRYKKPKPKAVVTDQVWFDNDMKTFSYLSLRFYQKFISSQAKPQCPFQPSCSNFSLQAIRQYGIIDGYFMTFDRLSRCNGLQGDYYDFDQNTGLLSDPVSKYPSLFLKNK